MSGTLASSAEKSPPGAGARDAGIAKKKHGCGCLGFGDRADRTGDGTAVAAESVVAAHGRPLDSGTDLARCGDAAFFDRSDLWILHGAVAVHVARTPRGLLWRAAEYGRQGENLHAARRIYPMMVSGYLKNTWLDAAGRPTNCVMQAKANLLCLRTEGQEQFLEPSGGATFAGLRCY
jgi:hypothetical protein